MRRCLSRNMKDRCENMEFEQLVKLIDVVSKSALNSFKYEEKGVSQKDILKKDHFIFVKWP